MSFKNEFTETYLWHYEHSIMSMFHMHVQGTEDELQLLSLKAQDILSDEGWVIGRNCYSCVASTCLNG
jgi:hypothetical protein